MTKRVVTISILSVVCLLLWWLWPPRKKPVMGDPPTAGLSESVPIVDKTRRESQTPKDDTTSGTNEITSANPLVSNSNAFHQWSIRSEVPIVFYGKVIDENSNAVAGANVGFTWSNDDPTKPTESLLRTHATSSDAEGQFSLHGARGRMLDVRVNKEGYYTPRPGTWNFRYWPQQFSPDPLNPVVFTIRKKGTPETLIHVSGIGARAMRDFALAADGTPTEVSLRDGSATQSGQGDLKVEFHIGAPLENFPARTTWQCQVTIPRGGLIQTEEEFPFLAPEGGYHESDNWTITSTNWTEKVQKQYYVKLPDGKFARVQLRVIGVSQGAFFRMESFLNPSGSRNLEPAN